MDIRKATVEDLPRILEMGFGFAETTSYKEFITAEQVGKMTAIFLTSEDKVILVNEDLTGMVWGMATQFPWGVIKVASEMVWWVDPSERGHGLGKELLKALNEWALEQDCKILALTGLDKDVASIYEKAGFELYERTYFKRI